MRLSGKVALVTGAQQGIGEAIALTFGREGASVVVNYLDDQAAGETIVKHIHEAGGRAVAVAGSVARVDDVRAMVDVGNAFGDVLLDLLARARGGGLLQLLARRCVSASHVLCGLPCWHVEFDRGFPRPLAGTGVGAGALAAHRQALAMARAAIAAEVDQALD